MKVENNCIVNRCVKKSMTKREYEIEKERETVLLCIKKSFLLTHSAFVK